MNNWWTLVTNLLWILGCALVLATFSYASWEAWIHHEKLRSVLARPKAQNALDAGVILFSLGLAGSSEKIWEAGFWLLMAIIFLGLVVARAVQKKSSD